MLYGAMDSDGSLADGDTELKERRWAKYTYIHQVYGNYLLLAIMKPIWGQVSIHKYSYGFPKGLENKRDINNWTYRRRGRLRKALAARDHIQSIIGQYQI